MDRAVSLSAAIVLSCAGAASSAPASPGWVHPDGDAPIRTELTDARSAAVLLGDATGASAWGGRGTTPEALFIETGSDPEGDAPSDVVFTPDGETIIIAHRESSNLILWDADTRAFLGSVEVSGLAQSVAVTPDGATAVVACLGSDLVSIVDLATQTETATIAVGRVPCSVSISPDGARAAVHSAFDTETAIIDIASATVERTVTGINTWSRLSFSGEAPAQSVQYGGPVFAGNGTLVNVFPNAAQIQLIDPGTGAVTTLPIAATPARVAVSADGATAVVAHSGSSRTLTIVDIATASVSGTVSTAFDMQGPIALNADATKAAVTVLNATRVVDLTTGAAGGELATASLSDIVPNFDGTRAVGIGFRGPVIDFATGTLLGNGNEAVSCEVGAASPTDDRAAMCSTTFGDDLVVIETDTTPSLEAYQLSGPLAEADRTRTVAVSDDGSVAVAVSIFSDSAAVIDTATGAITARATVGERPSGVAITPDGTKAVVANLDSTFTSIIDLATGAVTDVAISRRAGEVAISPDGVYAYLPVIASGDGVWRVNLDTASVEGFKLPAGNMGGVGYSYSQTSGIALSDDGSKLAVAGSFDDVVTIIDTASWTVDLNVPVGDFPTMVTFSDDGTRLYCAEKNDDAVAIIAMDQAVPSVISRVNVGDQPWHLALDEENDRLYVNAWADNRVNMIDLTFPVNAGGFVLDGPAVGLALDTDAGVLYAADGTSLTSLGGEVGFSRTESGRLTMIEAGTLTELGVITFEASPSALAFDDSFSVAALAAPTGDGAVLIGFGGECNDADFAEPFGVLDLADITAFVGAFNTGDLAADLAAPEGVLDLADLSAFVVAFTGGCP